MPRRLPATLAKIFALPFLLAPACASPTLPLPPPELPTQSAGVDADHITLSAGCGSVENGAVVVIINQSPQVAGDKAVSGALASSCGQWDASVFAHSGDLLEVTQLAGTQSSPSAAFQVR
ncbi:MAG TPA: hypothetical protein VHV30_01150 [Polyangiaceae bacterium]|jgi:hypothetical protein|nr:hypothetical protein [Polyangiaceae bacterium]